MLPVHPKRAVLTGIIWIRGNDSCNIERKFNVLLKGALNTVSSWVCIEEDHLPVRPVFALLLGW